MTFKTCTLDSDLRKYIQSIFHFKGFKPEHSIERVVPDGYAYLIFELDGLKRFVYDNETLQPRQEFTRAWISGMHRNFISISAHENSEMLVVQFKAGGAYPFFKIPMDDITGKVVPAEAILGVTIFGIRDKLIRAQGSAAKFEIMKNYLNDIGDFSRRTQYIVRRVILAIRENASQKLRKIVEESNYSQKQIIRLFKKYVGLNPKTYQRIIRFNEILPKIMNSEKISWAQLGADCGYYDQSHFIKEFKLFSGYNPEEFLEVREKHTEVNFFPLD